MAAAGGDVSKLHMIDKKTAVGAESVKRFASNANKGGGGCKVPREERPFYAMVRVVERIDPSFKN
jgi:hypothetical protein